MFSSYQHFRDACKAYIYSCHEFLSYYNSATEALRADHICYKCGIAGEFEKMRALLEDSAVSEYFHQTFISERRIAYFKLRDALQATAKRADVGYVELADKKPGKSKIDSSRFHHIEIYPEVKKEYNYWVERLKRDGRDIALKEQAHHTTWDITLANGFILRFGKTPLIQKIIAGMQ